MGIIRPQTENDGFGRWAILLDPDQHLIGTRAGVLAASERLTIADVSHAIYRRPGVYEPWQLVQGPVT